MYPQWFDFITNTAFYACFFICLFEGVRRLKTYGVHKAAVLLTLFGAVFCLAYSGFSFWKHATLNELLQTMSHNKLANDLPANWGNDVLPEKRETISTALARMAFVETGKFHSIIDKSGARKTFSPTEDDIKSRDSSVEVRTRLNDAVAASLTDAWAWLIWGVMAVILGLGFSQERVFFTVEKNRQLLGR